MKQPWPVWVVVSIAFHAGLGGALLAVGPRTIKPKQRTSTMTQRKIELPPLKPKPKPRPKPKSAVEPPRPKVEPKTKAKPIKVKRRVRRVRRRVKPIKKPPTAPASGTPKGTSPPNTGRKTFGIKLEGKTTAPTGQGVAVPKGDSVAVNPAIRKRGPPARGFKKRYRAGDSAPLAVITTKPLPTKRVMPAYPERARDLGIEGRVVLQLTVNGKGRVVAVRVLRKLHPDLDKAAIAAARKMRFKPATVNGVPVKVKIPYSFAFVLD